MQEIGNMTLEHFFLSKMLSKKLLDFFKTHKIRTLKYAMSFLDTEILPTELRKELERFKNIIEDNVKAYNQFTIDELYLKNHISKRLWNCLKNMGLTNMHQVIHYINTVGGDCGVLLKQRHFGKKCLNEIDEIISLLKCYNCELIESKTMVDLEISMSTTIESLHTNKLISMRTRNSLHYMHFYTIGDVVDFIEETGSIYRLLTIRNFGKKSFDEIKTILNKINNSTNNEPQTSILENESNVSPKEDFFIHFNELIKNDDYRLSINSYYENLKLKLSTRAFNIIEENFNSLSEILNLYFSGIAISNIMKCGKKTYDELVLFVINVFNYISSLLKNKIENTEIEISLFKNIYPFLPENELKFVIDFKKRMLRFPMFYILYHYLIRSQSRFERLFCRYHGIGCHSESLKEISESMGISFERCRQLLRRNDLKETSLITSNNWNAYCFLDDILLYNNIDYKEIVIEEGLAHLTIIDFINLCSLIKNISVCKVNNKSYYLSEKFSSCFDLKNCIKDIDTTLNKKCTEDIILPISIFIDSYWLKEPAFNIAEVEDIIISIIKNDYGKYIGEDKILYISQNTIDRKEEIYKIIEEYGKPMHITLIQEALIIKYPELAKISIEQIRALALNHNNIVALGKTSTYAIDKWNLFTGTIRDLIYDILSKEVNPLTINELYNKVSQIYPKTNHKSITSLLVSDDLQRFVKFVGSYYGIASKMYDKEYVVCEPDEYNRRTFNERLKDFEDFLKSHHYLPRNDKDNEDESSLYRWYKRVTMKDDTITSEQKEKLSSVLLKYKDYLISATEYSFHRYCEDFKEFIEEKMEFPTSESDPAKYSWFMKHKRDYNSFEDRRKTYFEDLIDFLYTYGFEV